MINLGNFEHLLDGLDYNLVKQARSLLQSGALLHVESSKNYITGVVNEGNETYQVEVELNRNRLNLFCNCETDDPPCVHILTLLLGFAGKSQGTHPLENTESSSHEKQMYDLPLPWQRGSPKKFTSEYYQYLDRLTVPQMRELAARRKIALTGSKRDIVHRTLSEGLAQPENISAALTSLSSDARRVLDQLCILGRFIVHQSPGKAVEIYLDAAQLDDKRQLKAAACLHELRMAGLLFFSEPFYEVPDQVLWPQTPYSRLLPEFTGKLDTIQPARPDEFISLVLRLLMVAQSGQLHLEPPSKKLDVGGWKVSASGEREASEYEISTQDSFVAPLVLEQVAKSTAQAEEKIDLAARLLDAGGFWERRKPNQLTARVHEWLGFHPDERIRFLVEKLILMKSQFELDQACETTQFKAWRVARGYLKLDQFLAALGVCRWRLVDLLSRLPGEVWFGVEEMLRLLHGLQPDLLPEMHLRTNASPTRKAQNPAIFLGLNKKPVDLLNFDAWQAAYGQIHVAILSTSLHWLGLVDLGWQGKKLTAFRLSPFGEYLLGRRSTPPDIEGNASRQGLVYHTNGWVEFKPEGASADVVTLLLLAGEPVDSRKQPHGAAQRLYYRITSRGLGQAVERGWDEVRITTALEDALKQPLPAELSERIKRICARFGRLHIYPNMTLVRFSDDFCLPELLAATRLNRILLHAFSPRLIAVRTDGAEDFLAELREKGYTPRVEGSLHG
jgi:hypothetical protein